MRKYYLLLMLIGILFCSCNTSKKILYLQDFTTTSTDSIRNDAFITIQPGDIISVVVSSKDAELAVVFNLARVAYSSGSSQISLNNVNNQISGYAVDTEGLIDFPILGQVKVDGLTRNGVAKLIKDKILTQQLLKDPIVTVDFINLNISIMGEVKNPGKYPINKDRISLLEGLSLAGDLTIYGVRENILVIREINGKRNIFSVDLRSADMFKSPAYYLQQNDIVYVQPNSVRAGQSTINENNLKSVSLWVSVASFLTSLGVLIFK